MSNKRTKQETKNILKVIEPAKKELYKSSSILRVMSKMVGNESTMSKSTLNEIDQSIQNMQKLRKHCRENPSDLDDELVNTIAEFSDATIEFYKENKKLHRIHLTKDGMDKRLDSADHIKERIDPAEERFLEEIDNLDAIITQYMKNL